MIPMRNLHCSTGTHRQKMKGFEKILHSTEVKIVYLCKIK
jgi:hypothetical protein